jgi:ribonuclease P protein component
VTTRNKRYLKSYRLCTPSQYRNVFSTDLRSIDSCFVVLAKNNGLEFSRLGLAISKKKIHAAVARNRIKRIVRESFRLNDIAFNGYDLVVMAQKKPEIANKEKLRKSIERHWSKLARCENS